MTNNVQARLFTKLRNFALILTFALVLVVPSFASAFADDGDEPTTYNINSGYTMQGIYNSNKDAMDSADEWKFDKSQVYMGTSNPSDQSFVVPTNVTKMTGYGTTDQGTALVPYYYNYDNHDLVIQSGAQLTVDNFYFAKDSYYGAVNVQVEDDADVTFKDCYFEGDIKLSNSARVKFINSTIAGAIAYNNAYTVLENTTFTNPSSGVSFTVDSNLIKPNGKVGEDYSYKINLPSSLSGDDSSADLKSAAATSNVDGVDASEDGASIVISGKPEKAGENGVIMADLVYNNDNNGGFRLAIPYYLSVDEADPVVEPAVDDKKVDDGKGTAEVKPSANSDAVAVKTSSPETGDDANLVLWIGMMSLAAVAALGLIKLIRE